jgi:hypothetical protein
MSGDLVIAKSIPRLVLNKPDVVGGNDNQIIGSTADKSRWCLSLGAQASDSFWISRYDDAGVYVDSPLYISRANGMTETRFGLTGVNAARLNPSVSVDTAAFVASGSFGGGLTFIDGAWRAALFAESSNLVLATGAANPPARARARGERSASDVRQSDNAQRWWRDVPRAYADA